MQSTLDYATIIFGSKDEARRLYVEELKMLLTKDSLNSVTPFQYAEIHISTSILRSL